MNSIDIVTTAKAIIAAANAQYCVLVARGENPTSNPETFSFAKNQKQYALAVAEDDIAILAARGIAEGTPERRFALAVVGEVAAMLGFE